MLGEIKKNKNGSSFQASFAQQDDNQDSQMQHESSQNMEDYEAYYNQMYNNEHGDRDNHVNQQQGNLGWQNDQIVHDTIYLHGLRDIHFTGSPFTWSNQRNAHQNVKTRIDRALANNDWFFSYINSVINNLLPHGSDHAPILLQTQVTSKQQPKIRRFYQVWFTNSTCKKVIEDTWNSTENKDFTVTEKLQATTKALSTWNHKVFGHVNIEMKKIQNQLQKEKNCSAQNRDKIKALEADLNSWYDKKAAIQYQQARENIIKKEDRNNKYFHVKANFRRRGNHIDTIQNEQGTWVSTKEEIH
ncbi:uncharacterized protein LOC113334573 [Papaver somniferum]|uniref:uncharacterized protein LOC113334573 n=1 Tax=Papaver somniferum TaxID=3469 RepID=UPI000E6F7271|nr:uncharacterized protein LOC113334573 [Papaver somniferum]